MTMGEFEEMAVAIMNEVDLPNLFIFDIEDFKYDWLIVIRDLFSGFWRVYWDSDLENFKHFLEYQCDAPMVGFNIKHYDNPMINAMLNGHDVVTINNISKEIIGGTLPWNIDETRREKPYDSCDLMDDCQLGVSLKGFEAHMGMNIVESSVSFDIDRKLTEEEKAEVLRYCMNDVDATIRMLYERRGYLGTKVRLGKKKGIPAAEALYMTNAKLTAKYLGAIKQDHDDQFAYEFPKNVRYEYIDQGVIDFFKTIKAGDLLLEDKAKSYTGRIGSCEFKVGAGGIHGCNGVYNMIADDDHLILNDDVMQFYPSMIVENGYLSRNVPNPDDYKQVTVERAIAKKAGDKKTANCLKLVNNTTYGAQKNQYNDLYDPLMALSICLSGQLYLLELATHLYLAVNAELIQLNTDGIMFRIEKNRNEEAQAIMREWQDRTHFVLEEDNIELIIQKDVNNYLERQVGGATKVKGGMLVRGISYVGAFKVNNNMTIVPEAVQKWFFEGIPVEDTINACNDPLKFQIIAKGGSKFKNVYHLQIINGDFVYLPVQNCNRVYATTDTTKGKLYKQREGETSMMQIPSLPDYCIIDNSNEISIDRVNKSWYIEEAKKIVKAFTQEKLYEGDLFTMATKKTETENMAIDYSGMNIYAKLLNARIEFGLARIQPSGYNGHADFDYFELADIVPVANRVFAKVGLIVITSFTDDIAEAKVINLDKPDEFIIFTVPHAKIAEPAKFRMNEVQACGSSITYLRRYLMMLVLDIVQSDEIDCDTKDEAPAVKPAVKATPKVAEKKPEPKEEVKAETKVAPKVAPKAKTPVASSKTPATPAQRTEIKKELTNAEGMADELQIKKLKELVGDWVEAIPANKEMATKLILKTEGFTKCTKAEADEYIDKINQVIAKAGK